MQWCDEMAGVAKNEVLVFDRGHRSMVEYKSGH